MHSRLEYFNQLEYKSTSVDSVTIYCLKLYLFSELFTEFKEKKTPQDKASFFRLTMFRWYLLTCLTEHILDKYIGSFFVCFFKQKSLSQLLCFDAVSHVLVFFLTTCWFETIISPHDKGFDTSHSWYWNDPYPRLCHTEGTSMQQNQTFRLILEVSNSETKKKNDWIHTPNAL